MRTRRNSARAPRDVGSRERTRFARIVIMARTKETLALALDQGGQSSRAIVFDARGRAIVRSARPVLERRIGDDRVEQDAEEIVSSLCAAAAEAIAAIDDRSQGRGLRSQNRGLRARSRGSSASGDARSDKSGAASAIACAGLATQRSSLVCWDRASGAALSPVISWQDRRARHRLDGLAGLASEIHRRTGLFLSPHYGASKLAWCLEHLPEVARARESGTLALGPLSSFVAFRLSREHPFAADPANASRTLLYSLAERGWDPWLCALFGVPSDLLPACVPTLGDLGHLDIDRASIPLRAMTGDQSAAIFAEGEPDSDSAYVNIGTGAFVQRVLRGAPILVSRLLTSIVSTRALRDDGEGALFVIEGTINGAGSALRWIAEREEIDDVEARLDEWLEAVRDPPIFLNGVSGLAAPYWSPSFRSRFVGTGDVPARVVAVIESVVFLVAIILDEMESALPRAKRIQVSGGLARSDALCARLADATRLPVRRTDDPEATARGLAWQLIGADASWRDGGARVFEPRDDTALARRKDAFRREIEHALGLSSRTSS